LLVAAQTGLRVSELTGLDCGDVAFGTGAYVGCEGKGRKQRAVPLTTATAAALDVWMVERAGRRDEPLFPTRSTIDGGFSHTSADRSRTGPEMVLNCRVRKQRRIC
jgi:integrase